MHGLTENRLMPLPCQTYVLTLSVPAGFEQAVKEGNQSELGKRNGGSMLSLQASERALLCYLLSRLDGLDPDVLVVHNVSAFDLDILLHRLQHHKVIC